MNNLTVKVSTWSKPAESLTFKSGEVHVWRLSLDQPEEVLTRFRGSLDPSELERAQRFYFEGLRRHFVAGRGFLRAVLARYLRASPEALSFSYGAYGKPSLAQRPLQFNMSHSHGVALLAVSEDKQLGVDVEHIRSDFATEDIARRFFSRAEVEVFDKLAEDERVNAFFRCWTRKEAYIKAIGLGLSQPLDGFDVTLAPGEPAVLVRAGEGDTGRWTFSDINVGAAFAAALAAESPVSEIRCWDFDPLSRLTLYPTTGFRMSP